MSGYLIAAGIVVAFLAGAVVFLIEVRNAVDGWEDGDGFHYGTEPSRIDDERND